MLSYQRVQEIVREYQAKWEIINAGIPEVIVANQNPASNVGALIDAQIDLNYDLAADLIRKLNEEQSSIASKLNRINATQSARAQLGFSSK